MLQAETKILILRINSFHQSITGKDLFFFAAFYRQFNKFDRIKPMLRLLAQRCAGCEGVVKMLVVQAEIALQRPHVVFYFLPVFFRMQQAVLFFRLGAPIRLMLASTPCFSNASCTSSPHFMNEPFVPCTRYRGPGSRTSMPPFSVAFVNP
jgi:hypothetical protein